MGARALTSVIHKEEDLYVAECPEVGTISQGYTVEEAVGNLKEATELYLEEFPPGRDGQTVADHLRRDVCLDCAGRGARRSSAAWCVWVTVQTRQRGSHVVKKQTAEGEVGCVVPLHWELAAGTLRSVLP